MFRIKLCHLSVVVLALMAISACSVLPERKTILIKQYGLPVTSDATDIKSAPAGVLLIARPRANKAFDTLQMAYRRDSAEVSYYAKSRWVDTPAQLVAGGLQTELENHGLFDAVVPQGTPITADWRLELSLLRFIQDYSVGEPVFEVQLRVRLINVLQREIAATRVFTVREPMQSANAEAGVEAAIEANSQLIAEVVQFLATVTENQVTP